MLSKKHRFHGLGSLRPVYNYGKSVRGPLFLVKVRLNPRRKSYRAAIVVGRKVNKSAVARNRIRRRLYEALRLIEPNISGAYDIVVNVFSDEVAGVEFKMLLKQLKRQLKQAGVISDDKAGPNS